VYLAYLTGMFRVPPPELSFTEAEPDEVQGAGALQKAN
jgi:putrescine importer